MIVRLFRLLREKRALDRRLRARKVIRMARAEAARRGISTEWQRRGAKAREVFGQ